ncbi:hypothetical protein NMK71_08160 [Weeksellaceae bacterium KMM 9713]|uniref:Uncharacterized protein n=1 Tax=Profundicola chukchiensis TaxID=2961959 RepID=A0A9X4N0F0_9FLAO|nr:hypothetical protein [Profundicola chukchiensis]MDG4946385.1 hypothetical protein [Profundicola chukchiensis]
MIKEMLKLSLLGIVVGFILMIVLGLLNFLTGSPAYDILFNFYNVPVLNEFKPVWLVGYLFHFLICILSVIGLYYILKNWHLEKKDWPYILVYTMGSGTLICLTALSDQTPPFYDQVSWLFWAFAHGISGAAVVFMVRKWL